MFGPGLIERYLTKIIIAVVMVSILVLGGCQWGKGIGADKSAKEISALTRDLEEMWGDRTAALASLKASESALAAVNAESARRIEQAKLEAEQFEQAAKQARKSAKAVQKALDEVNSRYAEAKKKPECDKLMSTDLLEVCGL